MAVDEMAALLADVEFDSVLGPESRGFIFGVPLAYNLRKAFIPVRKMGKLPYATVRKSYSLEYGDATLEMHADAVKPGQRVVIVDDLLATGGTCSAIAEMVEDVGGEIAATIFLIELENLGGRQLLERYTVRSVLQY
jgi:adenine phosphoribosyltransferase